MALFSSLFVVVVFTGLPHPPNEENMAQQFIQDITVLSGDDNSFTVPHVKLDDSTYLFTAYSRLLRVRCLPFISWGV